MQKTRQSYSQAQLNDIRAYHDSQFPKPPLKIVQSWFQNKYHITINLATLSRTIRSSPSSAHPPHPHKSKLTRAPQWPLLETKLAKWVRDCRNLGDTVSEGAIAAQAEKIWPTILEYRDHPVPKFSPGWIHRFKTRHRLLARLRKLLPPVSETKNLFEGLGADLAHSYHDLPISSKRTHGVDSGQCSSKEPRPVRGSSALAGTAIDPSRQYDSDKQVASAIIST